MLDQENLYLHADEQVEIDKFQFEPIKGYPMLNWKGKRPFRSTQYYPAQKKEVYGDSINGWFNKLFWGDNLQVMSYLLKDYRGKVDLIYIDPPFDSKADYKKTIKMRGMNVVNDSTSFEEKQYTDIWTNDEYLQFMYERLLLMRELLADTGCIYLHCDRTKSHLLRCLLDEVFGQENFLNEIIWCYKERETSKRNFNNKHDTIFFYAKNKSSGYTFNYHEITEEYSPVTLKKFKYTDEDNRKYRLRGRDGTSDPKEESEDTYRQYLDEQTGPLARDWFEMPFVNQAASERLGYPTQKPEALLEKFIKASSNKGDLVFDCFMGSGTTQAVAMRLGRRFIGADINVGAIQTATKRLVGSFFETNQYGLEVYNVNHYDIFRNPIEAKDLLLEALEVHKYPSGSLFDGEKDGRVVKIMPVNRISTKADLNSLIAGFDYQKWEKLQNKAPNQVVESILLVCMGHEPDLQSYLEMEVSPFKIDVQVVDILKDKSNLEFKRDAEAHIDINGDKLSITQFYPMNLLQKLSIQQKEVKDWKELVESIMIDWNYDGAILHPSELDIPEKNALVSGEYKIPEDAGTIRVKITDLLSESWEGEIEYE